jgi:hypothetical protein
VTRARLFLLSLVGFCVGGSPSIAALPRVARVDVVIGSRSPAEGGPETSPPSPLKSPFGVDFDSHGTMFIVELEGGRVHARKPDGSVSVIAGNGRENAPRSTARGSASLSKSRTNVNAD